jgi:hypothetical protein
MVRHDARDRRGAARHPATGRIRLTFEDPLPVDVEAELVDTSIHGFRASHASKTIVPGLELKFEREDASGRARVIWTHVRAGTTVSGFLIL